MKKITLLFIATVFSFNFQLLNAQEPATDLTEQPEAKTAVDAITEAQTGEIANEPKVAETTNTKHTGLSLTGEPHYKADSTHFNYVNPNAPKGGVMRLSSIGTFDNLNPFTIKGNQAAGLFITYDPLMAASFDEGSTQYCHVCEWVSYPDDFSSVTFKLREIARFHDGEPIKAEDVIFSMMELKKANPRYGQYYKNVVRAEKTGEGQVTFFFDVKNNRELPLIVGQIFVMPKHYWTANNKKGEPRSLAKTTLQAPLSSGPYKIGVVKPGQRMTLTRVEDYWAKDLFTSKGQNNFNTIKFEYFRDSSVAFEAFKADNFDYYNENSSINWARNYEFKSIKSGRVIRRDDIVLKNPQGMQGFVFNTRLNKFSDARVREALSRGFNFEWTGKNLFYNQYKRTTSYFENSELASSGKPSEAELALLTPLKADIPAPVLTDAYSSFKHEGAQGTRKQLRAARALLKEAGWNIVKEPVEDNNCGMFCKVMLAVRLKSRKEAHVLRNDKGEALEIEFLIIAPAFQRVIQAYVKNLHQLGVKTSIRLVDPPQYQKRLENFEFDVIISTFGQSDSPGNEQRYFWGTKSASTPGSRNYAGIKNKAVDSLIDTIIFAKNRTELITATKALDRVLLFGHYMVPNWHAAYERIAYWNRFGQPKVQASRAVGAVTTWWYDEELAEKITKEATHKDNGSK